MLKDASEGALKGILEYNTLPLVLARFHPQPGFVELRCDADQGVGNLVKVSSWYDNEWGFSNRMLDTTVALGQGAVKRFGKQRTGRRATESGPSF
ncbi:MAG: hypothetical protein WDN30_05980 [Pararobbsia sp.]